MAAKPENLEVIQAIIPDELNLDIAEDKLQPNEGKFIKNVRRQSSKNNAGLGTSTIEGDNREVDVPLNSVIQLFSSVLPAGKNQAVLTYESKATNEIYWGIWNINSNHTLLRLNQDGTTQIIYQGANLGFRLEPQYRIPQHKCWLEIISNEIDTASPTVYFVFVDAFNRQRFIDVETSIATGSFNVTNFPYYQPSYPFCDTSEYIELPTRPPYNAPVATLNTVEVQQLTANSIININVGDGVIGSSSGAKGTVVNVNSQTGIISVLILNSIIFTIADTVTDTTTNAPTTLTAVTADNKNPGLPNFIANQTYQFRTAFYLTDGRQTAWSPISTLSYAALSPCEDNSTGLPRSFNLLCNAGSPLVEKVLIAYRTCNGDAGNKTNPTDWYLYDTVNKYKPETGGQKFYQRTIGLPNYNAPLAACSPDSANAGDGLANSFIYYFDNSKESTPISIVDTNRLYDDIPFKNYGLTSAGGNIITANGLFGWDNLPQTELNKLTIGLGAQQPQCNIGTCTIIVDAVIHNFAFGQNEYISASDNGNGSDVTYGGDNQGAGIISSGFGQNIGRINPATGKPYGGLTGYLAGTNFTAISQQYQNGAQYTYIGVVGSGSPVGWYNAIVNGNYFIQRFYFYNVPVGKYVFRVSNQQSLTGAATTSAAISGQINRLTYVGHNSNPTIIPTYCEYEIDATAPVNGIVNPPNYLVIADLATKLGFAATGYITEEGNIPIELAEVTSAVPNPFQVYSYPITDHNGYYWMMGGYDPTSGNYYNGGIDGNISFEGATCNAISLPTISATNAGNVTTLNQSISLNSTSNYTYYSTWAHAIISGKVTECDGVTPIPGVPVVLTGSQYAITDDNGNFSIEAHNNVANLGTNGRTNDGDDLYVSQTGVCLFLDCTTSCTVYSTLVPINYNGVVCWNSTANHTQDQTKNISVNLYGVGYRGLKNGGTYGWAGMIGDDCGRQGNANFIQYLNVPVSMENGNFSPYPVTFTVTSKLNITDPYCKTFRLARTKNLNYPADPAITGSYLQWVLSPSPRNNSIEYVDDQGNIVSPATARYIRLYIDGLNNYNSQNNFATNDAFTWAPGARIRFLVNGNGTVYSTATNDIIDLQLRGTLPTINGNPNPDATDYFVIDNDTRLQTLQVGAMVELYYPAQSQGSQVYFENETTFIYAQDADVKHSGLWVNGQPILIGVPYTLNTFDTYWFNRAIPQNNIQGFPSVFVSKYLFEHYAPSDFCCAYCEDIGRINVIDIYAAREWRPFEREASNVVSNSGVINGISTFYSANQFELDVTDDYGDITGLWSDGNILFTICEYNWATERINDDYLRLTAQGVEANTSYLSRPPDRQGSVFGLQYNYPGAIYFYEGMIFWIDVSRQSFVECNYAEAKAVSQEKVSSYFSQKLKYIDSINNQPDTNYIFLHIGLDPKNKEVLITNYNNDGQFVNISRQINIPLNDTIVFDYVGRKWRRFAGYTPEAFATFTGSLYFNSQIPDNQELISFVSGIPYAHNNNSGSTWNNFYGTQCEKVIEGIFNIKPEDIKNFFVIEEYCLQCAWYVDRAITSKGQLSIIPLASFEQRDTVWYSEIYADQNTPNFVTKPNSNPLFDGDPLIGQWIRMRFVADNSFDSKYTELKEFILKGIIAERTVR